ncbi:feruloyl esterase B precursor, partial [Penicillium angulare]|uniref:feruloyl esterase B precursor n=1 Tax=Penicillium angulare TaxID=116970 RepID=UPI00253FC4C2
IAPGTNDGGRYTIKFCNVTVKYTHPGWNDTINTQIWLPLDDWNGRFQALGCGGYATGLGSIYLTHAVAQGYSSASTDGGFATGATTIPTDFSWNYAFKATNDMAIIGKQITISYYGRAANYSYFTGCSGGGRQGLMMAQTFPDAFDGILAISPASHLETFIPAAYWPEQVMNQNEYYPSPCEVEGFTKAAVKACDRMDGVEEGIISDPSICNLTAYSFVGQNFICNGTRYSLAASGAQVVEAAWSGSGKEAWFGLNKGAAIGSYYVPTACSGNGTCYSSGAPLFGKWISNLVVKDPDLAINNMTNAAFSKALHASFVGNVESYLSSFDANGGKMITWHGIADEAIPPNGTIKYYDEVLDNDPEVQDFYRFFEAPGVAHCYVGLGPIPNEAISILVAWVEKDDVPVILHATNGK